MTTIEHQAALARIEEMRRYADATRRHRGPKRRRRLAAPATSRPGDGRLQAASLNRRAPTHHPHDRRRRCTFAEPPTSRPSWEEYARGSPRQRPGRRRSATAAGYRRALLHSRVRRLSGAHEELRAVLGETGADIAAAARRRIQVPRTALGADGVIPDAVIRDEADMALRTAERRSTVSRKPARAMFGGRCQGMCPMCGVPVGPTMSL